MRPALRFVLLGVAAVGVFASSCSPREPGVAGIPPPPDGLDPLVARTIEQKRAAVHAAGDDPRGIGELGRVYHANKLFDLARRCYEMAHAGDPGRPDWPYFLGTMAQRRGQTDRAVTYLRRAIALDPDYAAAYSHLGDALLDDGDLDGAAEAYAELDRRAGNRAWGQIGLGRVARRRGELDEAIRRFERALAVEPESRPTTYALAMVYREASRAEDADRMLRRFRVSVFPQPPPDPRLDALERQATGIQVLLRRAASALEAGNLTEAEELYAQVLAHAPAELGARMNLGRVYFAQRRFDRAERQFRDLVETLPENPEAQYGLARSLLAVSRTDEAAARLREVLRLDPGHREALELERRLRDEATP